MSINADGFTITLRTGPTGKALDFYQKLLGRKADFRPHDDFHEWELAPAADAPLPGGSAKDPANFIETPSP